MDVERLAAGAAVTVAVFVVADDEVHVAAFAVADKYEKVVEYVQEELAFVDGAVLEELVLVAGVKFAAGATVAWEELVLVPLAAVASFVAASVELAIASAAVVAAALEELVFASAAVVAAALEVTAAAAADNSATFPPRAPEESLRQMHWTSSNSTGGATSVPKWPTWLPVP